MRFKAQTYKESICGCITYTFSKLMLHDLTRSGSLLY